MSLLTKSICAVELTPFQESFMKVAFTILQNSGHVSHVHCDSYLGLVIALLHSYPHVGDLLSKRAELRRENETVTTSLSRLHIAASVTLNNFRESMLTAE